MSTDDLNILGGMLTPTPTVGTMPASFDTGTVTAVVDTTHVKVNLGDKEVTVFVPQTLANAPVVDATVRVSVQENSYVLDSVITGAGTGAVPIGSVVMWATATAPDGWLKLDGSTFDANTYPVLYAVLGTTTLPNMADRFPIGTSGTKAVKATGGSASITQTESQMPNHTHGMSHNHGMSHTHGMQHQHFVLGYAGVDDGNFSGNTSRLAAADATTPYDPLTTTAVYDAGGTPRNNTDGPSTSTTGGSSTSVTGDTGGGSSMNILNPYLSLNFIIKAA